MTIRSPETRVIFLQARRVGTVQSSSTVTVHSVPGKAPVACEDLSHGSHKVCLAGA
jgi:hypothetical protein